MKKLFIIGIMLFLFAGCITTFERQIIVPDVPSKTMVLKVTHLGMQAFKAIVRLDGSIYILVAEDKTLSQILKLYGDLN